MRLCVRRTKNEVMFKKRTSSASHVVTGLLLDRCTWCSYNTTETHPTGNFKSAQLPSVARDARRSS